MNFLISDCDSPKPKPVPRRTPIKTPVRTPQPQESEEPWVESNSTAMNSNPVPTGLSDAFDFYIDSVRFIPDNSSMIKVTPIPTGLCYTAFDDY